MLINSRRFEKNSCFVFLCNAKLVIAFVNIGRVSRYPGTKISWSQQSFLTESTIYIFERSKKSMSLRIVPGWKHTQECHACQFFFTAKFTVLHCRRNFVTCLYRIENLSYFLLGLKTMVAQTWLSCYGLSTQEISLVGSAEIPSVKLNHQVIFLRSVITLRL